MSSLERHARTLAIALLLAGFLFRAWAVGHARFTGDESYFWATARNTATFEAKPVYGPAMTGSTAYHPGPLFYYLMAVPQRLGVSPWFGGLFVVLLHALSSALLGLLAFRARGVRAGLIALAIVAFAPWDVLYADRIWLSCVAPVWGAIILYSATRLDSPRMQGVLLFFALTCPQLHMSAPIVWIAAAVLALTGTRPLSGWKQVISKRAVAIGFVLAFGTYLIPLLYEIDHDFSNTRAILTKGGGKEPGDVVAKTPFRVLGYAMLAATSEIGYHFETGYWRTFEEGTAYFSGAGLARWWDRHGPIWSLLTLVTVLASTAAWLWAIPRAVRDRRSKDLETRVVLALIAGLLSAMLLLMVTRKPFFPHYTNLLMPLLVWPLVMGLDRLMDRARAPALALIGATALAMLSSSARYYTTVDNLNGLDATVSMVDMAMSGPQPIDVTFDGFYNRFAWEMLASTGHKRSLPTGDHPVVRYRVRNTGAPTQALSENATVHHGVVVEVVR